MMKNLLDSRCLKVLVKNACAQIKGENQQDMEKIFYSYTA